MSAFIAMIRLLSNLITWGVIIHTLLGYFLGPFHPARQFTSRLFDPLLNPIRQMLPQSGMLDFSPLILIILVQLLEIVIISVL
ncbi:MAG: YggT family protein [Anaerolineales bacterium]|nr:YggT family protein [Anaerolineales bacterium]